MRRLSTLTCLALEMYSLILSYVIPPPSEYLSSRYRTKVSWTSVAISSFPPCCLPSLWNKKRSELSALKRLAVKVFPYLAVDAGTLVEEHIVGALDFRCPAEETWKYPDGSAVGHDTSSKGGTLQSFAQAWCGLRGSRWAMPYAAGYN